MKKIIKILLIIFIFSLIPVFYITNATWYAGTGTWNYRKAITIDYTKVSSTLTNFPVLITLTDTSLKSTANNGHVVHPDGGDILFTKFDGTTKLDHEIEKYDAAAGQVVAWVEIDSLSSTSDTTIYMYYGNIDCSDQWSTNNTWDSNFKLVQHMNDSTTSSTLDSTSNSNNGTKKGANEPIQATGKIGNAQSFDGTDDKITIADADSLDPRYTDYTFEAWVQTDVLSPSDIFSKGRVGGYHLELNDDGKAWAIISGADRHIAPQRITTDGTYLYITEAGNNRIVKRLLSDFSFVTQIGSLGTGDDNFNSPQGITNDGTYLYISDSSNNRIVKRLASDLSYVSQIGTEGAGNDQFYLPLGLTNDGTNLYIADQGNSRIVKRLASDLSYVSKIGTEGAGDNQFLYPGGITIDGTNLYVADTWNSRIVKRLVSDLSYVSQIGSDGSGNDQFSGPAEISTDGTNLYIADTYNNRIQKRLASDLSYVSKIGSLGIGNDQFNSQAGIVYNNSNLYITDTYNDRIIKRLASDLSYVNKISSTGSGNDQLKTPYSVASDGTYLYIVDQDNNRIVKKLASDLSYVAQVGSYGTGNNNFNAPRQIATDGTNLYIADSGNHRIVKRLNSDLSYVSQIGSSGTGNDQFNTPYGVCTDGTHIFVADRNNKRIVKRLASDLTYVSKIGSSGTGNDQFNNPEDCTLDDTNIYVSDTGNNRIVKRLKADALTYVTKIGSDGSGNNNFAWPNGITNDGTNLYISDYSNARIVKRLASDLSYVSQVSSCVDTVAGYCSVFDVYHNGGTLFIPDGQNEAIAKRLASDLSYIDDVSGFDGSLYSTSALTTSFHQVTMRITYSEPSVIVTFYIDGALDSTSTIEVSNYLNNSSDLILGYFSNYFNGIIDEFRISNTARSTDYILTSYNNQSSPGTFSTVASEEIYTVFDGGGSSGSSSSSSSSDSNDDNTSDSSDTTDTSDTSQETYTLPSDTSSTEPITVNNFSSIDLPDTGTFTQETVFNDPEVENLSITFDQNTSVITSDGEIYSGEISLPSETSSYSDDPDLTILAVYDVDEDQKDLIFDQDVLFTLPIPSRRTNETPKVYYFNEDSNDYELAGDGGTVSDDGKYISFEFDRLATFAIAYSYLSTDDSIFSDILDHWAISFIEELYELSIIGGYEDGSFRPNNPITRAELTKIALTAYGIEAPEIVIESSFTDVDPSLWYAPYIGKAKELNIIEGYDDGLFKPNDPIQRVEALKILLEASGLNIEGGEMNFPDTDVGTWYEKYVAYAALQGFVSGYEDGTFGPANSILRGEACKIVGNILEKL